MTSQNSQDAPRIAGDRTRNDAAELDGLTVYRETAVGWDARTPPNESVDADGQPSGDPQGFGVPDPRAPSRRIL